GMVIETEEKAEIVQSVEGLSTREAEKALASLHPENPLMRVRERERAVGPSETEIRFVAGDGLMEKLQRIKVLLSHQSFEPEYAELFEKMADAMLDKIDP